MKRYYKQWWQKDIPDRKYPKTIEKMLGPNNDGRLSSKDYNRGKNQAINQYPFIWWNDITTDTNAIAIYIAGLECSKAEYPECPAANNLFIEHNY